MVTSWTDSENSNEDFTDVSPSNFPFISIRCATVPIWGFSLEVRLTFDFLFIRMDVD
jgi:hypothetical protein